MWHGVSACLLLPVSDEGCFILLLIGCLRIGRFFLGFWVSFATSPSFSEHALLGGPQAWRGGSWLSFQDLPAMGADFIQELAASSGSSWMSQAPNLHLAMQLLKYKNDEPLEKQVSYLHPYLYENKWFL